MIDRSKVYEHSVCVLSTCFCSILNGRRDTRDGEEVKTLKTFVPSKM